MIFKVVGKPKLEEKEWALDYQIPVNTKWIVALEDLNEVPALETSKPVD